MKIFSSSRKKPRIRVEIYSKPDCHLCEEAKAILKKAQGTYDFELSEIDIREDSQIYEEYKEKIPFIFINGKKAFKYRVDPESLARKLKYAG